MNEYKRVQVKTNRFWSQIISDNKTSPSNRYYNSVFFISFIISSVGAIFNIIELENWLLNISNILYSLIVFYLFYLSRYKYYYNIWITLASISGFLTILWISTAGILGSTTFFYMLILIVLLNIAKRKEQSVIFLVIFLNIIILYLIEFLWGEKIVRSYPNKNAHYADMMYSFVLALIGMFFLARFFKRSFDNEKQTVEKQKKIIEEYNTELLDSLRYASDLQKKIISNGTKLNSLFEDHFVLFKPKDIVSGDFFWVKEKGKYGIVVAADCTGHGVPAAFLSILGISVFEDIITHEAEVLDAGIILDKVREKFIPYLRKEGTIEGQSLDGIDLGICVVNYEEYTLQYSGANRPMFMVRNNLLPELANYTDTDKTDTHTLYTFKATKNTIGFNYKEDHFYCHTIEYYPSDTFYLFSDGFADQFDSDNKKKFNVKRLKNELLKIQNFPLASQGIFLNNTYKTWKGETPQTDDILLIGLRL